MNPREFKNLAARLMDDLRILRRALPDPRVPWYVKVLLFLIACYVLSPIDLIPDFIPVLGLLDEAILVPLAIRAAVALIPAPLREELQRAADAETQAGQAASVVGLVLVLAVWIALLAWIGLRMLR